MRCVLHKNIQKKKKLKIGQRKRNFEKQKRKIRSFVELDISLILFLYAEWLRWVQTI